MNETPTQGVLTKLYFMLLSLSTTDQNFLATGFILAAIGILFLLCVRQKRKEAKKVPRGWDTL